MNNEELLNSQIREQTIADINREMANIANLARAYANATPEQRNNVNIQDIQAQMDRYNQLKQQRSDLYAQQEADFQKQLEANRIAQANTNLNTRGAWRVVRNNPPIVTETVVEEVATPETTPINVWQYSSWWNPIKPLGWRMGINMINMDNLGNNLWSWTIVEQATVPTTTATQPLNMYEQNLVNSWGSQNNRYVNPGIATANGMNGTWSLQHIPATQYRNSLPWYQQLYTPYSKEYVQEVAQTKNNPVRTVWDWYSTYRQWVGNDYRLRNNW